MTAPKWPNVTDIGRAYRVDWPGCSLTMTVRPGGDDCATISITGKAGAEVWMLGAVLGRLAVWADGDITPIDEALRDDKVGDRIHAEPGRISVTCSNVRGGVRFDVVDDEDEVEFSFEVRKRDGGFGVAVIADTIMPTAQGLAVMRDVLQRVYTDAPIVFGRMPGDLTHLRAVGEWASAEWPVSECDR